MIDTIEVVLVSETATAKLFMHGRSQAVRLPKEFRFPGTEVRVTRVGRGIMLEPKTPTAGEIRSISAELQRMADELGPFMPEGRMQPPMPSMDDIDVDNDLP